MRDKGGVGDARRFTTRDHIDLIQTDIRLGLLSQCRDDVVTLGRERQQFAAVYINGRDPAGDENKRLIAVDLN